MIGWMPCDRSAVIVPPEIFRGFPPLYAVMPFVVLNAKVTGPFVNASISKPTTLYVFPALLLISESSSTGSSPDTLL
ncbi:hypothetical protein D3C87_2038590 [compost metagenome]